MPPMGLDKLKHLVVLMLENRSFDHMLGALTAQDPRIDGLTGNEFNVDTTGGQAFVKNQAAYQGQLDPDPDHHFAAVDLQIFDGNMAPGRQATMGGFVKSYFAQQRDVKHSRLIMNYFKAEKLPVLTTLAREFALFNGWFASIPGPTLCNRAFAHYGTSFGHADMTIFYPNTMYKSIYQRIVDAGKTAKIYYFDTKSSTMEVVNLLQHQTQFFGLYDQFLDDCQQGKLPDYCLIEPNYSDHLGDDGGMRLASDQHPDHDVREGERFIASVYNAIKANPVLWESTALLITYDETGASTTTCRRPRAHQTDSLPSHPTPRRGCRSASIGSGYASRPSSFRHGSRRARWCPERTCPMDGCSSTPRFPPRPPTCSSGRTMDAPHARRPPRPSSI